MCDFPDSNDTQLRPSMKFSMLPFVVLIFSVFYPYGATAVPQQQYNGLGPMRHNQILCHIANPNVSTGDYYTCIILPWDGCSKKCVMICMGQEYLCYLSECGGTFCTSGWGTGSNCSVLNQFWCYCGPSVDVNCSNVPTCNIGEWCSGTW